MVTRKKTTTKKAAPKKASKKTAKKAVQVIDPSILDEKDFKNRAGASPTGEKPEAPMSDAELATAPAGRKLLKGTLVQLAGSNRFLELQSDVQVVGDGMAKDDTFVGLLARNRTNFDLNIGAVEGTWSPITARREED